ncbi:hypothetical protein [Thermoleptolyngbya sp. M55_K2018_002]|uniref:hypothetical protein n=1 Tax=Thermoleptolyngbya sp. M55_K2018_002 TaxID=2747808 RepID=UPI0019F6E2E7|nr:hypothetical protein [Thermoleptolyngbya sp. M55_K2018_002]HIK39788.1 hypothetical protein [Thermoleptolyngbya sp. M55_K2018_002]
MLEPMPPEVRRAIAQFRRAGYQVEVEGCALRITPRRPKRSSRRRQMPPNAQRT